MEERKVDKIKKRKWFLALVIGVLLLIPTIYSFVFLQAYWDPYGRMDQVPVAIVNEDEGKDGVNQGETLTNALIDRHALDLRVENASDAEYDLSVGKVYATLTIPKNFTKDVLSAETTEKIQAKITFSSNQKANYVVSQLLRMVSTEVKQTVNSQANEKIVVALSEKIREVPGQVQQIDDGLGQLSAGAKTLSGGMAQLNTGMMQLRDGTQSLQVGVAKLDGLVSGVTTLRDGTKKYTSSVDKYTQVVGGIATSIEGFIKEKLELETLPNIGQIANLICDPRLQLQKECLTITGIIQNLNAELHQDIRSMTIAETIVTINQSLTDGGAQINDGLDQLVAGVGNLSALQKGVNDLANGANTLADGLQQLTDGAATLSAGLDTAQSKIEDSLATTNIELKKLDGLPEFAAAPVNVSEEPINPVDKYGIAFAPFFISLSLWVGAFTLFVVFYSDRNQRFKNCDVHAKNKFKRSCCYMAAAIAQGLILGVLLKITLNLPITNWGLYLGSLILVSAMFEAIIEFLIVVFDDFGKFLALVLLIIQVAASGGTFPIEVVSGGFQWLYNLLPMRYSIALFKESTVTINTDTLIPTLVVIVSVTIVFMIGNVIAGVLKTKNEQKRAAITSA